jgi:hypothetical protein
MAIQGRFPIALPWARIAASVRKHTRIKPLPVPAVRSILFSRPYAFEASRAGGGFVPQPLGRILVAASPLSSCHAGNNVSALMLSHDSIRALTEPCFVSRLSKYCPLSGMMVICPAAAASSSHTKDQMGIGQSCGI